MTLQQCEKSNFKKRLELESSRFKKFFSSIFLTFEVEKNDRHFNLGVLNQKKQDEIFFDFKIKNRKTVLTYFRSDTNIRIKCSYY